VKSFTTSVYPDFRLFISTLNLVVFGKEVSGHFPLLRYLFRFHFYLLLKFTIYGKGVYHPSNIHDVQNDITNTSTNNMIGIDNHNGGSLCLYCFFILFLQSI